MTPEPDRVHPLIGKPDSSTHFICPQGPSDESTHHLIPRRSGDKNVHRCKYCDKTDSKIRRENGLDGPAAQRSTI